MKKLYLLFAFAFIFTPFALADNPGVDEVTDEQVVEEAPVTETEEEVVVEETTPETATEEAPKTDDVEEKGDKAEEEK